MIESETYYHLSAAGMDACTMQKDYYEAARLTWLCTGCAAPKPDVRELDAHIEDDEPPSSPLSFVMGCGLPLARKDFLFAFGREEVARDLYLGKVFSDDGSLLEDWVTFRGRYRLIIRGVENVSYRKCDECGQHAYFAMGERYLCPDPPRDASIFESHLFGLVATPELFERITLDERYMLDIERLQVLQEPKDGLTGLTFP